MSSTSTSAGEMHPKQPERKELCQELTSLSWPEADKMTRTAQYARDPKGYLEARLGAQVFEQRRPLLCVPDKVDRDVYGTGTHLQHFEKHIATLFGQEHSLFFITGIQAQLAAVRAHCDAAKNRRCAWHVSSHLEEAEADAYRELWGLERVLIGGRDENPTISDVEHVLALPEAERPAVIVLEIPNRTLGCKTPTFDDLSGISTRCRAAGVMLHCDGARIWEGEPYYEATAGKTFADIAALFDSIYVSFYKGLGGTVGAMLASNNAELMAVAKTWRRRAGGNPFTLAYQVIDDERGFNENIGTFARRREKMVEVVDAITEAVRGFTLDDGTRIVSFNPERATCCQIHTLFRGFTKAVLFEARDKVQDKTEIRVFERVRPVDPDDVPVCKTFRLEWTISEFTEDYETSIFVQGYRSLCEELIRISKAG